jgi:outer membrane immunogenic protein
MAAAMVAALTAAPPAFAGDLDVAVTPDVFTAPPAFASTTRFYNWTGAYVGINVGGGWGRVNWTSVPDITNGTSGFSGGLVGGTVGYNVQTAADPFVLGVEADIAWSGLRGTVPPASCAGNCEIWNHWLATARLRFGYAFDWIMPYATVGVAIGRLQADIAGTPFGTESVNNLGWAFGGVVEFAFWGPWRAKIEYLRVDLNGFSCNLACGGGPISMNVNANIVRVGLNYRLWVR